MTRNSPPGSSLEKTTTMLKRLGFGKSTLAEIRTPTSKYHDPDFPIPVRLSALGAQFWVSDEIDAWISQAAARQFPAGRRKPVSVPVKRVIAEAGQHHGATGRASEVATPQPQPQPAPMPSSLLVHRRTATAAGAMESYEKSKLERS